MPCSYYFSLLRIKLCRFRESSIKSGLYNNAKLGWHLGSLGEYICKYKENRDRNLTDGLSILEVGKTETRQPKCGCEKMSAR